MPSTARIPGAREARRPRPAYEPAEAADLLKRDRQGQLRPVRRGAHPPRRRPAPRRPDGARHGRPAARHGQDHPRASCSPRARRPRRRSRPAPTRSVARTWSSASRPAGSIRRRARDARHDGHGRQARPHPRPARPDAQPQVGHHHLRPRARHEEVKAGRVEFKVDKGGIIHVPFGKASFEPQQLIENLAALVDAINRARPSAAKGQYFKSLTVASTMGPGIRVDVPAVLARAAA